MTQARGKLVNPAITPCYHVIGRCVRRAFLCGEDHYSGKDYSHRREWFLERLSLLTEVFTVHLAAYAIMSNHYHLCVFMDWDAPKDLSDEEVARRWMKLHKGHSLVDVWLKGEGSAAQRSGALEIIAKWRKRLCNLSWFMKCLNEYVARRANKEDNCKGSFWESRFKSQALADEAAILSCMAYVDLNPIRAGMAKTPETSDYTSIQQRIREYHKPDDSPLSLVKDNTQELPPHKNFPKKRKIIKRIKNTPHPYTRFAPKLHSFIGNEGPDGNKHGLLFHAKEYLALVDWIGRSIRDDKRGNIPHTIAPILQRLGLDADALVDSLTRSHDQGIAHGKAENLKQLAQINNQSRLWASSLCIASQIAPS